MRLRLLESDELRRGHIHVTHHEIPHVDARRALRAYVPQRFREDHPRPLIVMFDGQNVFDDAPSFAGGWHMHRAVERLARDRGDLSSAPAPRRPRREGAKPTATPRPRRPAPIVVAVDHGHERRIAELSWVHGRFGEPRLDPLVDWLADVVVPAARARFAIAEGPGSVVLAGSSMGGLAAMYGHLRRPETFGGVLAMSPSFWVGSGAIFSVAEHTPRPWTSKVYLDAGEREARGALARDVGRMGELLARRGWKPGDEMHLRIDPRGTHSERSWRRRVTAALRLVL